VIPSVATGEINLETESKERVGLNRGAKRKWRLWGFKSTAPALTREMRLR